MRAGLTDAICFNINAFEVFRLSDTAFVLPVTHRRRCAWSNDGHLFGSGIGEDKRPTSRSCRPLPYGEKLAKFYSASVKHTRLTYPAFLMVPYVCSGPILAVALGEGVVLPSRLAKTLLRRVALPSVATRSARTSFLAFGLEFWPAGNWDMRAKTPSFGP